MCFIGERVRERNSRESGGWKLEAGTSRGIGESRISARSANGIARFGATRYHTTHAPKTRHRHRPHLPKIFPFDIVDPVPSKTQTLTHPNAMPSRLSNKRPDYALSRRLKLELTTKTSYIMYHVFAVSSSCSR